MKLKIVKAVKDGFKNIRNNPNVFLVSFAYFMISSILLSFLSPSFADGTSVNLNQTFSDFSVILITNLVGIFAFGVLVVLSAKGKNYSLVSGIDLVKSKYIILLLSSVLVISIVGLVFLAVFFLSAFIMGMISGLLGISSSGMEYFGPMLSFLIALPLLVFYGLKLSYTYQAILLNRSGIVESLKVSWKITRGNLWRILGLSLFIMLIAVVVALPFVVANVLLRYSLTGIITYLEDLLITIFILPWSMSAVTQSYLQLRR